MGLPEILQWIQYGRKTGTVVFERPNVVKKVFIEQGLIVSASSNDPREYLGQILVCFGSLTEDQLTQAFQKQKISKKLLGKILSEDFGVSEKQILESLRIKIEETIYDIFLWEGGKFIYSEGLTGLSDNDRLETAIPIEQVIFEGARRVDEWREFRKIFPSDDVVFRKKSKKANLKELGKDPILLKIYNEIDGEKNIQRILLDTHAPDYRGYEAFGKLYWADQIAANAVERPTNPKIVQDLQADLVKAADLFKSKKFDESYDLLENFLVSQPENEEAQTLFKLVRDSYLKALYTVCSPDAIPKLTTDFADLNEQIYSSKEGYLASRINGEWDVKSLMMISPLGELASLRILKRLYDGGMIKFGEK